MGRYVGVTGAHSTLRSRLRWRCIAAFPGRKWRPRPHRCWARLSSHRRSCSRRITMPGGLRRRHAARRGRSRHGWHLRDLSAGVRQHTDRLLQRSAGHGAADGRHSRHHPTRNSPAPAGLTPVVVGLLVVAIGMAFGWNTGYARSIRRAISTATVHVHGGLGRRRLSAANGWWWCRSSPVRRCGWRRMDSTTSVSAIAQSVRRCEDGNAAQPRRRSRGVDRLSWNWLLGSAMIESMLRRGLAVRVVEPHFSKARAEALGATVAETPSGCRRRRRNSPSCPTMRRSMDCWRRSRRTCARRQSSITRRRPLRAPKSVCSARRSRAAVSCTRRSSWAGPWLAN